MEDNSSGSPAKKKRVSLEDSGASGWQELNVSNAVPEIDEGLYSRQLLVLGHEAMRRMATCDVLISGLGGLGVEVAKNVILSGVKSVTLHDDTQCTVTDLTSQFYLTESDIGKNRADASLKQLSDLNRFVPTNSYTGQLTDDVLKKFRVVVLTNSSPEERLRISEVTHANNIALIIADTRGLFAQLFCDFGERFTVVDANGEEPELAFVSKISRKTQGVVKCLKESPHGLGDGDYVTFSEVRGMTELNNCQPRKVSVLGRFEFTIGDTSRFSKHSRGSGIVSQVKMPKILHFKPLSEALQKPEYLVTDFAKCDRPAQLHLAFAALHEFVAQHGALPRPWNKADARQFTSLAEQINFEGINLDVSLLETFAKISRGSLGPIDATIGGIVALEVIKACSGKFSPIHQWLYFDALECLPTDLDDTKEEDCQATGSRYDGQTSIFGKTFQDKLGALKYFVVGAGAIGCELLKNFAMMGVGAGKSGQVTVTDNGKIKESNLNRQFLYRPSDVHCSKSVTAASAVRRMNPAMNVVAHELRVYSGTEPHVFDDAFFESLDGVANAVDDVWSREYIDSLCVHYVKPLLESGTFGTMGHTQVVVPYLTESYKSSSRMDTIMMAIPYFMNRYPVMPENSVWQAKELFSNLFRRQPKDALDFLMSPISLDILHMFSHNLGLKMLKSVKLALVDHRPSSFQGCVAWARQCWQDTFSNKILQRLFKHPPDHRTGTGRRYWSGRRRCPVPLEFSLDDPVHLDFVLAAANLQAEVYGIEQERDRARIAQMVQQVSVTEFKPRSSPKRSKNIGGDSRDEYEQQKAERDEYEQQKAEIDEYEKRKVMIPSQEYFKDLHMKPLDLDIDSDTNFHLVFITSSSRLIAANNKLPPPSRHLCRKVVQGFLPAMVTTNSVVAGLVGLELLKVAQGHRTLQAYKNCHFNMALPFFAMSEPKAAAKVNFGGTYLTMWDQLDINGDMTLRKFLDFFQDNFQLEVCLVVQGNFLVYIRHASQEERLESEGMTMTELWQRATGRRLESNEHELYFQVDCSGPLGKET